MKTIPEGLLDEVVRRLVDEFDPVRIYLFGSHAWGKPDEHSDIDLMVILASSDDRPIDRMGRAQRCLRKIAASKDILVRTLAEFERYMHLRASLEYQVKQQGVVLYGPGTDRIGFRVAAQGVA